RALAAASAYASTSGAYIVEEGPLGVLTGPGVVFAAMLLVALGIALTLGREAIARRIGAPVLWPGLVIAFALLGLAIQRQVTFACVVMTPFLAAGIPAVLGRRPLAPVALPRAIVVAACALFALAVATVAAVAAPRAPDLAAHPADALDARAPSDRGVGSSSRGREAFSRRPAGRRCRLRRARDDPGRERHRPLVASRDGTADARPRPRPHRRVRLDHRGPSGPARPMARRRPHRARVRRGVVARGDRAPRARGRPARDARRRRGARGASGPSPRGAPRGAAGAHALPLRVRRPSP